MENINEQEVHIHKTAESTEGLQKGHEHTHKHSHQETKNVVNRLARAHGHLDAVKKMVEDGRDCSEVLIQLTAVISALNNAGKVILKDHINHCIVDAVESGDRTTIDNLTKAIDSFVK